MVQNLPSERKLPMGKVQKKTNNSAVLASHTYIKLTLVSFFFYFFFAPFPLRIFRLLGVGKNACMCIHSLPDSEGRKDNSLREKMSGTYLKGRELYQTNNILCPPNNISTLSVSFCQPEDT